MRCSNCGKSYKTSVNKLGEIARKFYLQKHIYICSNCKVELAYKHFIKLKRTGNKK